MLVVARQPWTFEWNLDQFKETPKFDFKDEEIAEVILPEGGPEDCIEEAVETCPTECIRYEE